MIKDKNFRGIVLRKIDDDDEAVNFAIMELATGKFVDHVSKTGRITFRVNPFNANYFLSRSYANRWLTEKKIDDTKFQVVAFEEAYDKETKELDDFINYGILPDLEND
ncbi:hypothetical protein [Pedobacter miscanthi]|uniref:hypothetical protein n=1 Tax=Pedobacter miscanthi TaxID=2259170 RepID=UPI0029307A7A|nr:hypothetical protein [Pedobacter miscanthi]